MRSIVSESELHDLIKNSDPKKQKVIACGNRLYIRVFIGAERSAAYYYRNSLGVFSKIADFGKITLLNARKEVQKLSRTDKKIEQQNKKLSEEHKLNPAFKEEIKFKGFLERFLQTKQNTNRKNYLKAFDELTDFYDYDVKDLTVRVVKEFLLKRVNQGLAAYRVGIIISLIVNALDIAVEDGYIQSHNFNLLSKSKELPKIEYKGGFRSVEFESLNLMFARITKLNLLEKYFVLFHLLVCLRPHETASIRRSYIDFDKMVITMPRQIMKIKASRLGDFKIPITGYMLYLIKKIFDNYQETYKNDDLQGYDRDYLFFLKNRSSHLDYNAVYHKFNYLYKDCTFHGFRKVSRTWFADHVVPFEIASKCLDHVFNPGGVDAVYQKSDQLELRREAMQKWHEAVYAIATPEFQEMMGGG